MKKYLKELKTGLEDLKRRERGIENLFEDDYLLKILSVLDKVPRLVTNSEIADLILASYNLDLEPVFNLITELLERKYIHLWEKSIKDLIIGTKSSLLMEEIKRATWELFNKLGKLIYQRHYSTDNLPVRFYPFKFGNEPSWKITTRRAVLGTDFNLGYFSSGFQWVPKTDCKVKGLGFYTLDVENKNYLRNGYSGYFTELKHVTLDPEESGFMNSIRHLGRNYLTDSRSEIEKKVNELLFTTAWTDLLHSDLSFLHDKVRLYFKTWEEQMTCGN